ncbi:hypothetical protein FRC04_003270 [Tulasnella sp. 424]|nr:hypothetical protein FRC04_003270 [Tulasnella sp. 424]
MGIRYGTASTWKDVVAAMGSVSNRLDTDEIVTISQKEGTLRNAASGRTIFCPDVKNIFKRLAVTPHPSAITSHTATRYQALMEKVLESQERRSMSEHAVSAEPTPPRWTPEEERAATIIQASFRRYTGRRPAGGVTAAEFETLAKRRIAADELLPPDRHWLICIRGPLPHVFRYLQRLQVASDNAVSAFNMVMESSEYEDLEEIGAKWLEIRTSGTIFSILDIVDRVKLIPGLVSSIRNFGPCPEDDDYALGVEPLLSDRVPWTQLEWNQPGRKRRRRRGTRSAPLA